MNLENFTYKLLIKELRTLEQKAVVYSRLWGPKSDEVKTLDKKIKAINLKILDIMDANRSL